MKRRKAMHMPGIKRVLSFVLALCLMTGMLPIGGAGTAAASGAAAETGDLVYNFLKISEYYNPGKQWSEFKQTGYKFSQITTLAQTTAKDASEIYPDSSITTEPWCYVGASAKEDAIHYQWGEMFDFSAGEGTYLQMKISAKAGYYQASTLNTKNYYAPSVDVFLAPVSDAENATDEKYLLGNIDPSVSWSQCPSNGSGVNGGNWSASEFPLKNIMVGDGEYLLTYRFSKNGCNNVATRFFLAGFQLKKHTITAELSDSVKIGQQVTAPLSFSGSELSVTYAASSDQPEIAKATIENGELVVEGVAAGKANITVTAKADSVSVAEKTIEITVEEGARDFRFDFLKIAEFYTPGHQWSSYWQTGDKIETVTSLDQTTKGNEAEIQPTSSIVTDPWCYAGGNAASITSPHYQYGAMFDFSAEEGTQIQYKVKVSQDGEFDISTLHTLNYYSPVVNIYFAPVADAANATDEKYLLGTADTSTSYSLCPTNGSGVNGGNWSATEFELGTHEVKAGEYLLTYAFARSGRNNYNNRFATAGLILKNTYVDPMTLTLSASEVADILMGQSGSAALALTDVSDQPVAFSKEHVSVEIADPTVASASVSEDGKMISISGLKRGSTTLQVTVTINKSSSASVEIPVTVVGDANVKILRSGEIKDIAVGASRTTALQIMNGNDEVEALDMSQIRATVEDESVAKVRVDANGGSNLIVTGLAAGETKVLVTAIADGKTVTGEIPVSVIAQYPESDARTLHYDFLKLSRYHVDGKAQAYQPQTVINLEQTTAGHANEIYPESTKTTDPWCFVGANVEDSACWFDPANSYVYGIRFDAAQEQGGWMRMKIDVPADGLYQAVSYNSHWYMLGIVEFFLAPVDAEDPMADQYSLGVADMYRKYDKGADAANWIVADKLGATMLSAGEYYLSYKVIGTSSEYSGYQHFASSFELEPLGGASDMVFTMAESATLKAQTSYQTGMSLALTNGVAMNLSAADILITPENDQIATAETVVDATTKQVNLKIHGLSEGKTNIRVQISMNGKQVGDRTIAVDVRQAGALTSVQLGLDGYNSNRISLNMTPQLSLTLKDQDGDVIPNAQSAVAVFGSSNENVAAVSEDGIVIPVSLGETTLYADVTYNGVTKRGEYTIVVSDGKTASTYYTEEKVTAARENAKKYSWAQQTVDAATKLADKYIGHEKELWEAVTTQELPRGATVGYRHDPNAYTCRYCGCDLRAKYSEFAWILDPMNEPFKIQCPDCRRKFPSNDFASFYKTGIDENGNWSYEKAKTEGQEYLKNILYPEKGEGWGVDDGYGYKTGKTVMSGSQEVEEVHTYIAYYNHWGLWHSNGIIQDALSTLQAAYVYTGDVRYGRVGAILIDRVADVYPDMVIEPYFPHFFNSDSSQPSGKTLGAIWECAPSKTLARAYDAFYPMMEDPQVISFLSEKASQYQMGNNKDSAEKIRQNCEDGILREIYRAAKRADIHGNFGMHQSSVATAAVILDTMPETKEMIDWVMQSGGRASTHVVTGGNVMEQILATVDRDGMGNESSPQYNALWLSNLYILADAMAGYEGYPSADLYNNPKFIKMFTAAMPLTLAQNGTAQIGDSGRVASTNYTANSAILIKAFQLTGRPEFAQIIYMLNGNSVDGLHGDIYSADPEGIRRQILDVIDTYGEYDVNRSEQMTGYGFSIIRSGNQYKTGNNAAGVNTLQDFWLYYGSGVGHKHPDGLNLGMEAFGVNMAPDIGYPEACDGSDPYLYWSRATLNHNTIMVNSKNQTQIGSGNGTPMHFDDSGRVKLMDVNMPQCYSETDIYRRTVVMVQASDEVSYGIDFFRVRGGDDHLYSFHSQSDEIAEVDGVTLVPQTDESGNFVGSYAGADIAYGTANSTNGYAWFKNVEKAENPGTGTFAADFKVTDFRDTVDNNENLHLRMTMVNDFDLSEVSVTEGIPAQVDNNPEMLKFVFARRSGKNLDSLFTTVLEPYRGERYIKSIENAVITKADGSDAGTGAKAVKVTLQNGRIDYIVYAADQSVVYTVDDLFDFQGFVGVCTLIDGEVAYNYLNDGTKIADLECTSAYTGSVIDFTKDLAFENRIIVSMDQAVDAESLAGKHIYITNDGTENAVYEIKGAQAKDNGQYALDIGDITLIRGSKSSSDLSQGYVYNIGEGQKFRIPLAVTNDSAPVFTPVADKQIEAGSELKFQVSAESPVGRALTYSKNTMPRGAQFDAETQTFSWIPDGSQVGETFASIDVTDGVFTQTQYVKITVYNSAVGGGSGSINNTPGSSTTTEKPVEPEKPVVTTEKDEVSFAASAGESTAETKLGSVTFSDGMFAADGQGKLKIERENETYTVSVTATVDMEQKPAKVSLNYTPADNMTDENCIVVKDENGNIIPNGRYENGKMTFYTDTFGKFTIEYNPKSFTDLGNHAWADDAITRLAARGIINGITATTYGPERNITRADFTTLIVRAFGFTAESASFADVPANAYYAEPVGIAKTLGIVGGVNETDFAPTSEITRQDMMVIVARALKKAGYVLDASETPEFSDTAEIADYAKDAVDALTKSGLIAGSNGKVNPKGNTTRAEVAVILDRILFMSK